MEPAREGREVDLAIDNGCITDVGRVGAGRREYDASGLLVTPGFVDVHTHYDAQVTWDKRLDPSSGHGCTTVVMGNCGVGFAPVKKDQREWLIGLMEGVEDIPGAAQRGYSMGLGELSRVRSGRCQSSSAVSISQPRCHTALCEGYVMGERGADNEDATPEDIAAMADLVGAVFAPAPLAFLRRVPLTRRLTVVLFRVRLPAKMAVGDRPCDEAGWPIDISGGL